MGRKGGLPRTTYHAPTICTEEKNGTTVLFKLCRASMPILIEESSGREESRLHAELKRQLSTLFLVNWLDGSLVFRTNKKL